MGKSVRADHGKGMLQDASDIFFMHLKITSAPGHELETRILLTQVPLLGNVF